MVPQCHTSCTAYMCCIHVSSYAFSGSKYFCNVLCPSYTPHQMWLLFSPFRVNVVNSKRSDDPKIMGITTFPGDGVLINYMCYI